MPGASGAALAPASLSPVFYLIALAVLAADQLVKSLVVGGVPLNARTVLIPGCLVLTHSRNSGAAFGMLPTATVGLIVVGVVVIAILLVYGRRVAGCRPLWVGLALQVGGALGNMVDRIFRGDALFHGRVVDYLDVQLTRTYTWPTFNLADAAITIGAVLIAVCLVTGKGTEAPKRAPA